MTSAHNADNLTPSIIYHQNNALDVQLAPISHNRATRVILFKISI